jgi:SAM-dependent methyltransferase
MLRDALRRWLRRQTFDPTLLGMFVNPFFLTRRALARAMRDQAPRVQGRVLDVGCGQKPYRHMFQASAYLGVEIDTPESRATSQADYFYDGRRLPFQEGEFDTIICNEVLEHVFEPNEFVIELNRVLRDGGTLVLTAPFVWDEHAQPYDYARYSSFGLRHLLRKHGFDIDAHVKTLGNFAMLCQLVNAYIYKVTVTRYPLLNLLLVALFMAPISAFGLLAGRVLPSNGDLYLDNVVAAVKPGKLAHAE